jgi:D-sedoheptulose 7-phosphate isomerase
MEEGLRRIFNESIRLKERFLSENIEVFEGVVNALVNLLKGGNKILLFGNGGSAADAQHIAAEFVNRFLLDRAPLPAMALTTDSSVLTAISNDFGFDEVFEKQISAIGRPGDCAIGISTSGESPNVVGALETARKLGLITVGLGGPRGTAMERHCDYYFCVRGGSTPRIQEVHELVGHATAEMVERILFGETE